MSLKKLDERIRLLEMNVNDLLKKMNVVYSSEMYGVFGKVVLLDNYRWTVITSLPVYNTVDIVKFDQYTEADFTFSKTKWTKQEISKNKSQPTEIGTTYNGKIQAFLDEKGYLNIKFSSSGYNRNTFISTIVT